MKQYTLTQYTTRPYITINDRRSNGPITTIDTQRLKLGLMATILAVSAILGSFAMAMASDQETKYCNPKVSKPCGAACILIGKTCHIPWTTALAGQRKQVAKNATNPIFVKSRPQ